MFRAAVFAVIGLVAMPVLAGSQDKRLDIFWADTEGGAGTLIVTPAGESILIDTGNPGGRDSGRIFKLAQAAGLQKINHLITTHYHIDHFGGAAELAKLIPIGTVYDNGDQNPAREKPDAGYLQFKADKRIMLSPGDEVPLRQAEGSPKISLKCLAARKKFIAPTEGAPMDLPNVKLKDNDLSDNANSIVTLLSFGGFRFFDGGDLTWNMEQKLVVPVNLVGQVDVYQVDHHGLDVSNNDVLLLKLQPTVAVMSNGTTKGCGPETIATLKGTKSIQAIYQTHRNLRPDGDKVNTAPEYIANTEQKCEGNSIQLSVDPAAKTYTMRMPATKHEKTFEVKQK